MSDLKQIVLDRDLNPYHSFFASFFAGLGEMGIHQYRRQAGV